MRHASALALVRGIEEKSTSDTDAIVDELCLRTRSRNNWLEYQIHLLVKGFEQNELAYFSRKFEPEVRGHEMSAVALYGDELISAVHGLRQLIASMKALPAMTASLLVTEYAETAVVEALAYSPQSIAEAIKHTQECCKANEGDDVWTLVSFLHGHLLMLDYAKCNALAAVYVLWLY
jgi:hypothetical protein